MGVSNFAYSNSETIESGRKWEKLADVSYYWSNHQPFPVISEISSNLTLEQKNVLEKVHNQMYSPINVLRDEEEQSAQKRNLGKLCDIKNEWNRNADNPVPVSVIDHSCIMIMNLYRQPVLYPTNRGSIQLQYEADDRSYLEFEVFVDNIVCMVVPKRDYNKAYFPEVKLDDLDEMNKILRDFYGVK